MEQLPLALWNRPFAEQVDFFRKKLNLPTERWDDILRQAHDKAFMVAGAQNADLLNDLKNSVAKAIEDGKGIEAFRSEFKQIVSKHGWTGWTGEESDARTAWRTKVIYQTNMSTSYAAGRYQQLSDPGLQQVMPYWQYIHDDSVAHPRPLHQSWDGLTLPPGHPFWREHYPPNGWGCQCRVKPVTKAAFLRAVANGRGPDAAPQGSDGIDQGFEYAPGENVDTQLRQVVQDKLISYPPAIARALAKDINRRVVIQNVVDFVNSVVSGQKQATNQVSHLFLGFVEDSRAIQEQLDVDTQGFLIYMGENDVAHIFKRHGKDGGAQRPPTAQDFVHLYDVLNSPDQLRQSDTKNSDGNTTFKVKKKIGDDEFNVGLEIKSGKKNRALVVKTMYIRVVDGSEPVPD